MKRTMGPSVLGATAVLWLAACGGAATTAPVATASATGQVGAATQPPAAATVASATVAGHGVVLVAGSNAMTLYTFAQDTPGGGTSACTGACISRWPALTVAAGTAAKSSVAGTWATIVRGDGGGSQVTYNGRPLYFFSGDSKPGDANGNYPGWAVVTVAGGAPAPAATTPSTSSSGNGYPPGY